MSSITAGKYSSAEQLYQGASDNTDPHLCSNNVSEDHREIGTVSKIQTRLLRFGTHLNKLRLEMVAFLFTFSYVLTKISSTSMIIDKVCLVHLKHPSYICDDLENHTDIKTSVEKLATNYQLGHTLIQTAPAAVLACFIGPWSDDYGRKFPVILALIGMIFDSMGSTVCAYFLESRVEYYFIPALFTGILGGPVSILAVVYSYASDSTPFERRTMKYAFLEMASGFAVPVGALAGGWIYNFFGYPAVFFLSTGGIFLSLIWVVYLLKETRGLDNDDPWSVKLKNLFSCDTFMESFIATAKERPHQGRKQVILLIISMCFLVITINSTSDINYLYVHHQFGWSNTKYSTITSIYAVFAIFLLIIVVPLLKYFKINDPYLGLLGSISLFGKNLGVGLAMKQSIYHIASLFGLLGGCSTLAARSRISKVVSKEDLGKVFSFVATAESLLPILTSILMSQLFTVSLQTFPGLPYIVLAGFILLPIGVYSWMTCLPKMNYEDISHTTQKIEDIHPRI